MKNGRDAADRFNRMARRRLLDWFAKGARDYPWRGVTDPYAVLVSEMMLQQTRVATVLERGYYARWMERFPDVHALAAAEESEVLRLWEGLGYYQRARNLHAAAKIVAETMGGNFPREVEALRALPGLGPYAAAAVACFAFDAAVPVVDGNIERVLARVFDFRAAVDKPDGKRALTELAAELVPRAGGRAFNSALMELGQIVCTPRAPRCLECPLAGFCASRGHDPEALPKKSPRKAVVEVVEHAMWAARGGQVMLHQEQGRRRQGLWKLPALPHDPGTAPVHVSIYTITHHRVTLRVHAPPPGWRAKPGAGTWHEIANIENLPMPAPYRRVARALLADASANTRDNSSGEKGLGSSASKNGSAGGAKARADS